LPKPSAVLPLPVYPDQRVSVSACLPGWLAGWLPVTAHEMFNLQIYWLNQAIVTRTVHFLSLSNLSLSHSLRLKQMKIYRKSLCLQL
jgi:hypothetical protein